MAVIHTEFYSNSLARMVGFYTVLPNDLPKEMTEGNPNYKRGMKTLLLLHGFTGSAKDWLMGSNINELAGKYNLAVIMPSGENSFYLDGKGTGRAYCRYVGAELLEYTRKTFGLSDKREDTFVGGLSMGGYGALHTGLYFPETFSKIIALSSALIVHNIENKTEGFANNAADYDYYFSVFGDLSKLAVSENNPEYLIKKLQEEETPIPGIYMACGTEDFLLQENRDFHGFLEERKVEVTYQESAGIHDWIFWNRYLEPGILWMLK